MLLDTGASSSFIRKIMVPTNFKTSKASVALTNAFGSSMCSITEKLSCSIKIDNKIIPDVEMLVIPKQNRIDFNAVLGYNVLKRFKLNLNGPTNSPFLLNRMKIECINEEVEEVVKRT